MKLLPDWITKGYLRLIDPVANWLVKRGVHPNTITVIGTICTLVGGTIYATGHIRTGGWFLGQTALFDVLDGTVARRSHTSSTFGSCISARAMATRCCWPPDSVPAACKADCSMPSRSSAAIAMIRSWRVNMLRMMVTV